MPYFSDRENYQKIRLFCPLIPLHRGSKRMAKKEYNVW
jgi:hypothetical protein